ncbi:MAG: hypothetical protein QOD99_1451 [Chthoniobacter sp.]|jgi:S1-C subfamily serine protease|nr:hypothetical protein [Chthoniobacter sp.]
MRNATLLVCAWLSAAACFAAPPAKAVKEQHISIVRVNATNQAWDFFHPWSKHAPVSRRALGAVLAGDHVLVTAELVANANYLELEKAESGERMPAHVEVVDYEANLALLKPDSADFLRDMKPLEVKDAAVGDRVAVWQLEATGALLITDALLTTVEVTRYPIDDTALLTYRLTSSLQYREGSFTVPVVKNGSLVGLLMRYDTRTQNVDVIPAPVIDHFLHDAASKHYGGFPRAGVLFAPMRDPQLRRHAGLGPETSGGVFLTQVQKGSAAEQAGMRVGDVLLAIGDKAIDQDGNYLDKLYGKISLVHLIASKNDGEKVSFKILRDHAPQTLPVTLIHRVAEDYVIEPYTIDRPPKYYVIGGLVLQELSRQYLKEWGEYLKKAPERFVYYDRYQTEIFKDARKKLVVLSQVLPSASTVGYEELNYLVVTKINDVPLTRVDDVARAVANSVNGFHKIEFEENPRVIYLDAKQTAEDEKLLMRNYGLPAISRLGALSAE